MHTLNIARDIKNMSVKEIRDFIFENYYKRIGFSKEKSCCSLKGKRFVVSCKQIYRKNT